MPRFVGKFEHTLDAKGRVILPARFRVHFEQHQSFLTRDEDGCLALWTPEEFDRQSAEYRAQRAPDDRASRNRVRTWSASVEEVQVDTQGRMALPQPLREYAGLTGEVVVIGNLDRVELWNPQRWTALEEGQLEAG